MRTSPLAWVLGIYLLSVIVCKPGEVFFDAEFLITLSKSGVALVQNGPVVDCEGDVEDVARRMTGLDVFVVRNRPHPKSIGEGSLIKVPSVLCSD